MKRILILLMLTFCLTKTHSQKHIFSFDKQNFLLDNKPVQLISGEMHPARIPYIYWQHRIQMAKAMGCNTIAIYVFWNYHELTNGKFDFKTENRNIAEFIRLCKKEKMWVLLRPGPYVCAEWDLGGLPSWLLKIPDIKLRCMDSRYISAVKRYIEALSRQVKPFLCTNGGPILMVQIENEYGSYGNDKVYLETLHQYWLKNGIDIPFYTADGPTPYMLEAGALKGCAVGLDSDSQQSDYDLAVKLNSNVPVFSSETYPGWLTHWNEEFATVDTTSILNQVKYLLDNKRSFNFYVIHGGTNFGFWAGANSSSRTQYNPDITSYDYDAPITEQGQPTPKYFALRNLISKYVDYTIPQIPQIPACIEIPEIKMQSLTSIWNNLPAPVQSAQPITMEALDQTSGFVLYRTKLVGHKSGNLMITEPHDYALVLLNNEFVDTVYRDKGIWNVKLPKTEVKDPLLDILVEGMGRVNFAQFLIDRKGITDRVTLNGMTLMQWEIYSLPMSSEYIQNLKYSTQNLHDGVFFSGEFSVAETADTYLDMSGYKKGVVWVNGHNLGRYWEVGPQKRLYCPADFMVKGVNKVVVFDLLTNKPLSIRAVKTLR